MVLDYSERRPVNKNRPKKAGGSGLLVLVAVAAFGVVFVLGFVAGWFAGKGRQRTVAARPGTSEQVRQEAAAGSRPQPQTTGTAGGVDPPLTFYNTLPKGSKAVIGTGLNPAKAGERPPASPPPQATAPGIPPATVPSAKSPPPAKSESPASKPAEQVPGGDKDKKGSASSGKYAVQVASYREKKEAETLRDKLVAKGMAAFIQESRASDRSVWYRLRVGRGLSQQQAGEIAAKLGKDALVVPE